MKRQSQRRQKRRLNLDHAYFFLENEGMKEVADFIRSTTYPSKGRARSMRRRLIAGAIRELGLLDKFFEFIHRLDPKLTDIDGDMRKYLDNFDNKAYRDRTPIYKMQLLELCKRINGQRK